MKPILLFLGLTLGVALQVHADTNILYQTSFEAPVFTPGPPIRGQDGWEMFSDGEAISVSTNNARTGEQSLRMDGALLEQTGPNFSHAYCFSTALDATATNPPPIVELTVHARLDGQATGTNGLPADDLMSANLLAIGDDGSQGIRLGGFLVSSAGKIFTVGSRPEDAYKFFAPMSFGTYHKLMVRVDFIARTVRYFADDVDLGLVNFASTITSTRLASGTLEMAGPSDPFTSPYEYNPANYTAFFDDYSIASVPLSPVNAIIEFASTNVLTDEFTPIARLNIVRRGFLNAAIRVTASTTNGTAMAGEDYEAVSTFVTFASGETNKEVDIPLNDDYWAEPDKAFTVHLTDLPPGATSGKPVASVLIRDDERPGSIDSSWSSSLGLPALAPGETFFPVPIVQPDGKILVSLSRFSASFEWLDHRVIRIHSNGTLDTSFRQIIASQDHFAKIFLMPDGKIIITTPSAGSYQKLKRFNPDGTPDTTLIATVEGWAPAPWVVGLPDGKMLLLGSASATGGTKNRVNGTAVPDLVRLNHDGSRDLTFSAPAGITFFGWADPAPMPVQVLPSGKILVGTESTRPVYLLNEDGSPDAGFTVTTATPSFHAIPVVVALRVQTDGKILVAGDFETFNGVAQNGMETSLVRLNPNGSVDDTFLAERGSGGFSWSLDILPNGQVLFWNLHHPDGTLDPNFEPDGYVSYSYAIANGQPIVKTETGLGRLRMNLPSRIVSYARGGNGAMHLTANALSGRTYSLQSSEDLANWSDHTTQPATTNRIEFTDAPTNSPLRRFYRVRQD